MNTKQLTYPSIESQKQFWIDKETVSDNATNETREDLLASRNRFENIANQLFHERDELVAACKLAAILMEPGIECTEVCIAISNAEGLTSHLRNPDSITADPKPEELSRTESLTDWYDHYWESDCEREQEYRLRDEGRNPDGSGESYSERNA